MIETSKSESSLYVCWRYVQFLVEPQRQKYRSSPHKTGNLSSRNAGDRQFNDWRKESEGGLEGVKIKRVEGKERLVLADGSVWCVGG